MFLSRLFSNNKNKSLTAIRWINNHSKTKFSQLGATFNQKPSSSKLNQEQHQYNQQQHIKSTFNSISKYIPSFSAYSSINNPSNAGLFGKKELNSHEGFYELKERAESRVNELIDEALSPADLLNKRKLVEIFDDISNELCCVADLAEFVRTSHPDVHFREAANMTFGSISQIVEKLNTNYDLYLKLKESLESDDPRMDDCDKRVCKLFLADFELSGIHLDESTRNNFVRINDDLVNILMKFQVNSQAPSQISSSDVEPMFSNLFKYYRDPLTIDTMYINSEDELLREFVYKTYLQKNSLQEVYFRDILSKRMKLANLCDFKTFSHRANLNMILETPENVMDFLNECSNIISPKAQADYERMREFKRNVLGSSQPLMQWDVPIISNKMKKQLFDLDRLNYMDYLSLGSCMEGLNLIINHLYNVNIEIVKPEPGEVWHQDIYKLAVKDSNNSLLGYIYCDFYHRQDKFSNVDCHFTVQCSKQLANSNDYQIPIVVLHLNFPTPSKDKPTLLSFEMMENLFHEFGHAMHSMFAKTRYQHVSGTRCSTDLAEVPSQLMEYYCREPKILKMFAKHYQTLEPMDDKSIHKLCESKKLFTACDLQSQLTSSLLDQAFHLIDFDKETIKPVDVVRDYTNKYHSLPYVQGTNWHLRYTHLVGYGAKYYSYMVSKAIASKIWSECFEKDPLSSIAGENYRNKLLQFGGEKRPQELINSLVGFELNNNSLVSSITKHI